MMTGGERGVTHNKETKTRHFFFLLKDHGVAFMVHTNLASLCHFTLCVSREKIQENTSTTKPRILQFDSWTRRASFDEKET